MIGIIRQEKSGFSLMEVIVSVALFAIVILSTTEIFRLVINGQREAIASQNVQESLKYFFEVTSKEIRMARRSTGDCLVPAGDIYALSSNSLGDILYFQNYYGECVAYELASDSNSQRFKITRGGNSGFVSPAKITIDDLRFLVDVTGQPTITMSLLAHASGDNKYTSEMEIQTSITSRYYR